MQTDKKRIGIGSFAFRFSIGTDGFISPNPMNAFSFITAADALGYGRVSFFDNIGTHDFSHDLCVKIKTELRALNISSCFGIKYLSENALEHYLPLAKAMGADCLRVSIQSDGDGADDSARACEIIQRNIHLMEKHDLTLGIENHFSLAPEQVVRIAEKIKHPLVKLIFDSTNSIRFIEKPMETLERMSEFIYAVHIKDYVFEKLEAGYLMNGAVLGNGMSDIHGLLSMALSINPSTMVEMELSQARPKNLTPEDILRWESDCVTVNTKRLFEIINTI